MAHKRNWPEAITVSPAVAPLSDELPPLQLAGQVGTGLPQRGLEDSRGERKRRQGG